MAQIPQVTVEELKKKLDDKERFTLLDVREAHELEIAKIPGAVHIPLGQVPQRYGELDAKQPVLVFCRSGGRSSRAVEFLRGKGLDATNVVGGILAWGERIDPSVQAY